MIAKHNYNQDTDGNPGSQNNEVGPIFNSPTTHPNNVQNPVYYGQDANGQTVMYSTPGMHTQPRSNQVVPINTVSR